MDRKPQQKTGLARIWAALFYSLAGLKVALSKETAFCQEVFIITIALVALVFLPLSLEWKGILFFSSTSVLIVELLNSSIESVVDMVSPKYHVLAKKAKDLSSAAVLLVIVAALVLWFCGIFIVLTSKTL